MSISDAIARGCAPLSFLGPFCPSPDAVHGRRYDVDMGVKDLVERYNSAPTPTSSASSPPSPSRSSRQHPRASLPLDGFQTLPLSLGSANSDMNTRPARFIKHPLLQADSPRVTTVHDSQTNIHGLSHDNAPTSSTRAISETPVISAATPELPKNASSGMRNWLTSVEDAKADPDNAFECESLLSTSEDSDHQGVVFSVKSQPLEYSAGSSTAAFAPSSPPRTSTSTLVPPRHQLSHAPIPLTTLIAYNAAPLHLPKLDQHISSLPPPSFAHVSSGLSGKPGSTTMFPPMQQLVDTGKTIEDLETNSILPPWYKNRRGMLGSIVNGALGLTVRYRFTWFSYPTPHINFQGSSFLASYYSLTGVFNTVQIFALILTTISP
jgi:hypothetical protein